MNIRQKFIRLALRAGLGAGLALVVATPAWSDVYKCVDEEGHVTYTNTKPSSGSKCTPLSRDQRVSTVPGTKAPKTPTPANFPRVDESDQKSRDTDRRRILEEELKTEQKNLEEAKAELATQETNFQPEDRNVGGTINSFKLQERLKPYREKIELHERNIESLQKEIGKLK